MSNYRIIPRHDTKANWQANNPILLKGEIGNVDDNPNLYKIGNGTSRWNDLPFRGYNGTVTDKTGNDENSVMSQKAVTEAIGAVVTKHDGDMTTVDSRLTELEKSQFPLTVATTLSSTLLEYTGVAQTVVVSYNVKRKGVPVVPESLKAMIDAVVVGLTAASSGSYNATVNKDGSTSIAIQAVKDGMTATETKTVQMVRAMYFGFSLYAAAASVDKASLVKQAIKTSPGGTYTLTNSTDGCYLWLCIPDNMTINKVTLNGFDVPMEVAVTIEKYKYYRSSNRLTNKDYIFVIS